MNKKHLIPVALSGLCALATMTALVNKNEFHFATALDNNYHITFTAADLVSHSYDDDYDNGGDGVTYFTVGRKKAIDNKYDLFSDELTYVDTFFTEGVIDFDKADSIFEIASITSGYDFSVCFSFVKRALFDLTQSKITYYSSLYGYTKDWHFEFFDSDSDRNYYWLSTDEEEEFAFVSHYGKSFKLISIDLYFGC